MSRRWEGSRVGLSMSGTGGPIGLKRRCDLLSAVGDVEEVDGAVEEG